MQERLQGKEYGMNRETEPGTDHGGSGERTGMPAVERIGHAVLYRVNDNRVNTRSYTSCRVKGSPTDIVRPTATEI